MFVQLKKHFTNFGSFTRFVNIYRSVAQNLPNEGGLDGLMCMKVQP